MNKQIEYYTLIHTHSDLTNGTTNIDSVTKFEDYIKRAKAEGMKAIAFTEHGNTFGWVKKKETCEKYGLKYIHSIEAYVTESLDEKIRDNYHICLYAKNFEGVKELNKMITKSYNRKDGHFYYTPRMTFDDILNTSENIIIATACLGGILNKGHEDIKKKFLKFIIENKDRCFLEIQHHNEPNQKRYNVALCKLAEKYKLNLITGTDTHALNQTHAKGRTILQKAKNIHFGEEDLWDIVWKTKDELIDAYKVQGVLDMDVVITAMKNTNVLADMVEEFTLDRDYKYPKLYSNSSKVLMDKIKKGVVKKGVNKYPNYKSEYVPRIKYELETYQHNKAFDFLLLDEDIKTAMRKQGIYCGPSRGSVSGSLVAYLIGMTEMDSIKHNLNFERFMNKERVSLADVDTDWSPTERDIVKKYIYEKEGLYCADIITFNTVADKGSIRDVCRAIYTKEVPMWVKEKYDKECKAYGKPTDETAKLRNRFAFGDYLKIADEICSKLDLEEERLRKEYPEVFEYADIINGTVVSIGTHPCGVVVSPIPLDENMGLLTLTTCENPVTMLNMKEIDSLNYVKLDVLGLDNIELINKTCDLAGIPRLTPDNVPDEEEVWKSIRDNTLGIFQWEGTGSQYIKHLFSDETIAKIKEKNPNFKYIDLFSVGNGAIRPAGESYRAELSDGIFRDNGHDALNELLSSTLGFLVYQEQILDFLHLFCGYTMGEADIVRRGFAKKTGTEQHIPRIKAGFIKTMKEKYNVSEEKSEELIVNFLQIIEDASSYLFSLNHSQAYSYIGYMCGWLRYHYPLEFLTVMLNINSNKMEKTTKISEYARQNNIKILPPKFGYSKADYFFDKSQNAIYKGVGSVKFLNKNVANELYELSQKEDFKNFTELLVYIKENTSLNSKQLTILIKLGYFSKFGKIGKLLSYVAIFDILYTRKTFNKEKFAEYGQFISKHANSSTEKMWKDVDKLSLMQDIENNLPNEDISIKEKIKTEIEFVGVPQTKNPKANKLDFVVVDANTKYTPTFNLYRVCDGRMAEVKVNSKDYNIDPIEVGDMIRVTSTNRKERRKKVDDKWVATGEYYLYISYEII